MVAARTASRAFAMPVGTSRPHLHPSDAPGPATRAPARSTYPPPRRVRRGPRAAARSRPWTLDRLAFRVRNDSQLLLAIAIALAVIALDALAGLTRPIGLIGPA